MSFSGNILRVYDSPSNNYLAHRVSTGLAVNEMWVGYEFRLSTEAIAAVAADGYARFGSGLLPGLSPSGSLFPLIALTDDGGNPRLNEENVGVGGLGPFGPTLVAGTTYLIEFRYVSTYDSGTTITTQDVEIYVDGALEASGGRTQMGFGGTIKVRQFQLGTRGGEGTHPDSFADFDNLTVGTTRGATDRWADAFETDILSTYNQSNYDADTLFIMADDGGDGEEAPTGAGGVRVAIAFDDPTLEWSPVWTYLTATPSLVTSWSSERGRKYEFDRTDTLKATVSLVDRAGVLDPTNPSGPYYGLIEPYLQIKAELWNPVAEEWQQRWRGFIEDFDYNIDPSTHRDENDAPEGFMRLQISVVGLMSLLSQIEMNPDGNDPPAFGHPPPAGNEAEVFFEDAAFDDRITTVLVQAGLTTDWYVVFSGNVNLQENILSAGDDVMQVIDNALDAEFPTVSNGYEDRYGRFVAHGRLAKFDPEGVIADGPVPTDVWDFTSWKVGDGAAVAASPTDTAQLRELAFNRGISKVINSAFCTPNNPGGAFLTPAQVSGQYSIDGASIGQYGFHSWSAENLLVDSGILTGNDAKEECKLFADYIIANYKTPRNRVTQLSIKTMHPDWTGAAATWDMLCRADISDRVTITESSGGGGGFIADAHYIEGIREEVSPLNGQYALVTMELDLSPTAYFDDSVGLTGGS